MYQQIGGYSFAGRILLNNPTTLLNTYCTRAIKMDKKGLVTNDCVLSPTHLVMGWEQWLCKVSRQNIRLFTCSRRFCLSLAERGRRVLRVHMGDEVTAGLEQFNRLLA